MSAVLTVAVELIISGTASAGNNGNGATELINSLLLLWFIDLAFGDGGDKADVGLVKPLLLLRFLWVMVVLLVVPVVVVLGDVVPWLSWRYKRIRSVRISSYCKRKSGSPSMRTAQTTASILRSVLYCSWCCCLCFWWSVSSKSVRFICDRIWNNSLRRSKYASWIWADPAFGFTCKTCRYKSEWFPYASSTTDRFNSFILLLLRMEKLLLMCCNCSVGWYPLKLSSSCLWWTVMIFSQDIESATVSTDVDRFRFQRLCVNCTHTTLSILLCCQMYVVMLLVGSAPPITTGICTAKQSSRYLGNAPKLVIITCYSVQEIFGSW